MSKILIAISLTGDAALLGYTPDLEDEGFEDLTEYDFLDYEGLTSGLWTWEGEPEITGEGTEQEEWIFGVENWRKATREDVEELYFKRNAGQG